MSDLDSNDSDVFTNHHQANNSRPKKRQRLASDSPDLSTERNGIGANSIENKTFQDRPHSSKVETSDLGNETDESASDQDEITIINRHNHVESRNSGSSKKRRAVKMESDDDDEVVEIKNNAIVVELDNDNGDEDDDDDDDSDLDNADREDDAIIESLYDDDGEDNQSTRKRTSTTNKRILGLRDTVVKFFDTASFIDLESIPGVSKKKVEQIVTLRPIKSWDDLNHKIQNHKSSGINEEIVINAVKTIKSRSVVEKLMNDCQKLAQDIGHLVDRLPEAPQPKCIPSELKLNPYQLIGLNWLILLHNRGINGILADEMGLGKTIQVISFLAWLRERIGMQRHHLVIVPSSTLDNWEREFDTWCPDIKLLQYYGSQDMRARIRNFVAKNPNEVDVILTTYNIAQNPEDRKMFKKINLEYLVFDEAHMLKNMKSSRYQGLIKIRSKRRILLTGTPLQNNLVELMSLLVFTMPRMMMSKMSHVEALFSSASREEGGKTQFEKERIEQAKKIMKPFVLRRLKEDVLKQLPKKTEEVILCPMSETQRKLYMNLERCFKEEIKDRIEEVLDNDESFSEKSNEDIKKGAGMLMAMRRLANHPLLTRNKYSSTTLKEMSVAMLKESTHKDANKDLIFDDMSVMHDYELHQLCKQYPSLDKFKLRDADILDSGKFLKLDCTLDKIKKSNQKCLIFSQFTMMLDIMEEYMKIRDHQYVRLDGQTKVSDRIELIDEFNKDPDIFVFLLSTKAGGLGINLTAANVVIIHDIDFNPYNDKQAEDRSHRLGQTKNVLVYKLICKGSVEMGMLDIAEEKLKLGQNITQEESSNDLPAFKDMRSLLRSSLKL